MISRRAVLPLPLLALLPAANKAADFTPLATAAKTVEQTSGGRCGLALLDTASGQRFSVRANERFPMCSTFKLALAAQLLHTAEQGQISLAKAVAIAATDMVPHAPFTQPRIGQSVTLFDLAAATMIASDNPATNLILQQLGGPASFTAWVRTQGDKTTRLDRIEPMMSEGLPGDPRDTTSPAAMLALMDKLLFGPTLTKESRQQLLSWMHASETGNDMVRAGLPTGWKEGNKTGSGDRGIRNTISLLTPPPVSRPGRPPILLTIFIAEAERDIAARNRHHAALARALVQSLAI
jgi:beta-lactamase class A